MFTLKIQQQYSRMYQTAELGKTGIGNLRKTHKGRVSSQASVALENARLYRLTQMRAQELSAIFGGSAAITGLSQKAQLSA